MLFYGAHFWPQFWAVIGDGVALTMVLSLFVATVRLSGLLT
jgi:hypothetical protein